ncbi:hypothetical protein GCM10011581_37880 [Saccharopolyspora subtropica]|uniref:Uncharacterized protein n=1 Tax=Saccharopolyspora thermophila TaxID=89367 RepID=A0A917NGX5_9PSEU|nr:hypothetical protein [Saccharopolyspora subtropica]GGI97120.1 hypothetical protein GCM10011581_37880 [Saccharopolyspora subtropica]
MSIPSSLLTSAGLIGGFAVARATSHRHWGGVVAAGAGLGAMEACRRRAGVVPALVLGATYAAALTGSHPLAKKIGAWPSVFTATAVTAAAAHLLARPRHG